MAMVGLNGTQSTTPSTNPLIRYPTPTPAKADWPTTDKRALASIFFMHVSMQSEVLATTMLDPRVQISPTLVVLEERPRSAICGYG